MNSHLRICSQDPKLYLLYPFTFLANLGIGMLNFSLVYYMRDHFCSGAGLIGWLSSFWAAAYLAGCILLGRLNARLSPRLNLGIATLLMASSVGGILLGDSEAVVFICYILFGFFTAMFWPPLMGWLSEGKEGISLSRAIAIFNICWSSGTAMSPYLGGLLLQSNLRLPFYTICGIYTVLTLILVPVTAWLPGFKQHLTAKRHVPPSASNGQQSTPLRFPAWCGVFNSYLLHGALLFIFPLYARDKLGYTEAQVGLLLLLRAVVTVAGFQLSHRITWWHYNKTHILLAQGALLAVSLLLGFQQSLPMLIILLIFFGLIFSLQYSSSIFHGVSGSRNRERRMAVHESMLTCGLICGAAGGGILYEHKGILAVFLFCCLAATAGLIFQSLFLILSPEKKPK